MRQYETSQDNVGQTETSQYNRRQDNIGQDNARQYNTETTI